MGLIAWFPMRKLLKLVVFQKSISLENIALPVACTIFYWLLSRPMGYYPRREFWNILGEIIIVL